MPSDEISRDTIAAIATPAGRGGIGIVRYREADDEETIALARQAYAKAKAKRKLAGENWDGTDADAPDVHEAYRFWSGTFNAKVSDWIGDAACLMRIDPVHHKLAVFKGDGPGLCHMNFQVASIDDVFRNWHFLLDHDVEIEMGPGRHPQSTAIFLYFLGPEGFPYESSFGVGRLEDEADVGPSFGGPAEVGEVFLTDHLLAFEITSIVLLVAAVGGVILGSERTRKRS